MKYCKNCGSKIIDGDLYCVKCGSSIDKQFATIKQEYSVKNDKEKVEIRSHKRKSPFYKKWWFYVIIIILFFGVIGS